MPDQDLINSVAGYDWQSKEQREGYLALVVYMNRHGHKPKGIHPAYAFFIQKDHDSNEYWRELVGTQVKDLQDQIAALQKTIGEFARNIDFLSDTVRAQQSALDLLRSR